MIVHVPTPLRSYTSERGQVEAKGATLDKVLRDLDRQFPGFRFRIVNEAEEVRRHIKLYLGHTMTEDLSASTEKVDEVHIICALSGG